MTCTCASTEWLSSLPLFCRHILDMSTGAHFWQSQAARVVCCSVFLTPHNIALLEGRVQTHVYVSDVYVLLGSAPVPLPIIICQ